MAGDWIKMRGNLWDDPRVSRLVDLTDSTEAAIVGALYWLWATADQHSEDGILTGLSLKQIDRKTGVQGFGEALLSIGWIADHPEGVKIVRFEEHNGKSAKRRCSESVRKMSARDADKIQTQDGQEPEEPQQSCAPREREEKEKSKPKSKAVALASRLPDEWKPSEEEIQFCKTKRPDLDPSQVADRFRDFWIAQPGVKGRKLDWTATWRNWVRNEKQVKASAPITEKPWFLSFPQIEEMGKKKGIFQETGELPPYYKTRVYKAYGITPDMVSKAQAEFRT